jgi:RND family efflux transporter MFP subunit
MHGAVALSQIVRETRAGTGRKKFVLLAVALVLIAAGVLAYFLTRARVARSAASDVPGVISPQIRNFAVVVTTTGIVRLKTGAEVRVGAQVSGIVRKLNFTVGSRVRRGDVIAEIDSRPIDAQINQARTQVEMDKVALAKAQRDLSRGQQLLSAGLVPRQQTEDLDWQYKGAQAKLDNSQSNLAAVGLTRSYTVIRAPISGTVASVSTQEGETVAASFAAPTFVTIVQDNALELVAMVDETDIANVRAGEPVTFTVEAYTSREFSGTVNRIDPTATIISGVVNYQVVIAIRRGLQFLKPDMTANISIQTAKHRALVIPSVAIHREGDQSFVYVLRDGKQEKQNVSVGARDAAVTEIVNGLNVNDRVVTENPKNSRRRNP